MDKSTNRFSRDAFGGGEEGERAAHAALVAHEATIVPGARVRVYRGANEGLTAIVIGRGEGGYRVRSESDGLTWTIESRNIELDTPVDPGEWNAYRYPTQAEIDAGRKAHDMVWIGSDMSQDRAINLLPLGEDGQIQLGRDGEVVNVHRS